MHFVRSAHASATKQVKPGRLTDRRRCHGSTTRHPERPKANFNSKNNCGISSMLELRKNRPMRVMRRVRRFLKDRTIFLVADGLLQLSASNRMVRNLIIRKRRPHRSDPLLKEQWTAPSVVIVSTTTSRA